MYYINEQEQDRVVKLVYEHLMEKDTVTDFETIAINIANHYMTSASLLSEKQANVIGTIYYRQIFRYTKPTKAMIDSVRLEVAKDIAERELLEQELTKDDT